MSLAVVGVSQLRRSSSSKLVPFVAIGTTCTVAYIGIYAGLRTAMPAVIANAVALLVTAVVNTTANRRLTFAVRGRVDLLRHQLHGLGVFGVALAVTTGSLALLHLLSPHPSSTTEVGVLVAANLAATAFRFVALRRVFGCHAQPR
ncbi:MAG TPA: GtrA family protein [Mycobacteriales bacterium]|nr:GtrA family protein [Mycobacteriales bacterium]